MCACSVCFFKMWKYQCGSESELIFIVFSINLVQLGVLTAHTLIGGSQMVLLNNLKKSKDCFKVGANG